MFEYRLAREVHEALARHGVRYLFIGKSGAILLGYPDTTQDADLFPQKSPENGRALAAALQELGFPITPERQAEIVRGKDFVQLRNGPFDLDLILHPMELSRSRMLGPVMWRLKACQSATSTRSSPASRQPVARRTWSHCRA